MAELVERFTRALGPPVATPEWVMAADHRETRRLERARYRVWRWRCPVCGAGYGDPIWRPLLIDSDGRMVCEASQCSEDSIAAEIRIALDGLALLERLEIR